MKILVLNSGSSSVKYQLISIDEKQAVAIGLVERIGIEGSKIKHNFTIGDKTHSLLIERDIPDHKAALELVAELLLDSKNGVISTPYEISAVGHRVVHGGESFSATVLITDKVKQLIRKLIPLAPLHNPANLGGIEVAQTIFPHARQVAVFDTSYHQSMPEKAYRYAIPTSFYKNYNIRRYGFHGTSHKFVYQKATHYLKNKSLKAITLHLGNGASMAAIEKNKVKDTSMGFTPLAGLIMGTRSGDIDPSIIFYLMEEAGLSLTEVNNILTKESGMLAITGSSDMRDIGEKYKNKDSNAILGNTMYAYRIKKYIGAYLAALNGAEALIFTGGIGENDSLIRDMICEKLDFFGIKIDKTANKRLNHPKKEPVEIQADDSRLKILVIPTNEEGQIAHETYECIKRLS